MEPIPVYFDLVNRTAIIVKPKKKFIDWLKLMDEESSDIDFENDYDLYLLPDFESTSQIENWLKKNFDEIFCDQMNHWYTDESDWIQNRTFKLFKEFFDYTVHTMIWDTLDKPITKE